MNYLILYHLGLGDHIVMNGYIHYLLRKHNTERVCILAMNNKSKDTLEYLYSDCDRVSMHYFNNDSDPVFSMVNRKKFMSTCVFNNREYHILSFGLHSEDGSIYIDNNTWASSFYIYAGVDPSIMYKCFTLPLNMNESKNKYNTLIDTIQNKKYILIHDDPSRERMLNENTVKRILEKNNNINLPVIYLGINRYNYPLIAGLNNILNVDNIVNCKSLLDYYDIIKNATECHFMDSSIMCLTDQIVNSTSLLYSHLYIPHAIISPKIITAINRNWEILHN